MDSIDGALIVGAGAGLSASLARGLAQQGRRVVLAAREPNKLAGLCTEIGATALPADATRPTDVERLFRDATAAVGPLGVVIYNASARLRGPLVELDADAVLSALLATAYGAFLVGQQAARQMLSQGRGAILFTGASASVKGYAQSAPFAMGKFALRGLAQSMARELGPCGIHVAHVIIDGAIRAPDRPDNSGQPDSLLDPDAIAATYLHLLAQPRSAWAWEVELRPWVERF
jgi:NAD(P)-dependent dehydrogenase (short-subunit alcohol dehydrogenase family)